MSDSTKPSEFGEIKPISTKREFAELKSNDNPYNSSYDDPYNDSFDLLHSGSSEDYPNFIDPYFPGSPSSDSSDSDSRRSRNNKRKRRGDNSSSGNEEKKTNQKTENCI